MPRSTNAGPPSHGRTALVLYGSETGTAQDVAHELGQITERLHFAAHVVELNSIDVDLLSQSDLVIFAVSTVGQGEVPANARALWRSLLRKRLPSTFLQDVKFIVCGLGDSSYPKYIVPSLLDWLSLTSGGRSRFNWAGRKLRRRLIQLGAHEIYPHGEGDEQHPEGSAAARSPSGI